MAILFLTLVLVSSSVFCLNAEKWLTPNEWHKKHLEKLDEDTSSTNFESLYPPVMETNLVVSGAQPVGKNESIMRRVEQVGQRIGILNPLRHVKQAWRIWLPSVQKQVLVIKLKSKRKRSKWMLEYRKKRLWEEKLFLNEQMTRAAHALIKHSKELAKKYNWSYVWIQNGRIAMRKDNYDTVFKLKSLEHLYQVMNISTTKPLKRLKWDLTDE